MRTSLMLLAMSISVASVLLLTALGEGARSYIKGEFASLGTNLVIVIPGKNETSGAGLGTMMGITPRDLTLQDAQALTRNSAVRYVAPISIGVAEISWQSLKREVVVMGSTRSLLDIRRWKLALGQFLPAIEWSRSSPVCVIGKKIKDELFATQTALGKWIRLGGNRCRVIGIMGSQGRSIDVDVEELVIVPVASAQSLFNAPSLFRILLEAKERESMQAVIEFTIETIKRRHQGEEDITAITQDAVLQTFDDILAALTYGLGGIAAISLAVAGILIMNVMLVAVSQRTAEIGLLKALGASRQKILSLILAEAVMLSLLGSLCGFILGLSGSWAIRLAVPDLQAYPPNWALVVSLSVAVITGFVFSLLPARKAASLDPILALQRN